MSKEPRSDKAKQPRESLHHWILTDLEHQILSGAWPPGSQIPFEQDLAKQYGCSRMTVNKVMTKIAAAGLIERRRKAGSFVSRPKHSSAVLEIVDIRLEVIPLGTPCLEIDRRTWESGVPITAVRLLYPSAQKELIARFTPSLS